MSLAYIALILSGIGVLLWIVNHFIPMVGSIKSILNAVVATVVMLWLLRALGTSEVVAWIRMPRSS